MEAIFKLSVFVNMIDNLTQPMGGAGRTVDNVTSKLDSLDSGFRNLTKSGIAMAGLGMEITKAALSPVEATFKTRKAIGELASLGVEDLQALESAATSFSDTWAGTTKSEFLSAAYDIKSGIASLNDAGVAEYTRIAGITAKATKSTIGEMTDLFATGYGIYKDYYGSLSDEQFAEIFSAGIAKSIQQFKSSGSKMAQSIQSLGASATMANVPLEEQFAILGMLQATMGGGEAGTKYKAFLKTAAKAGEELGLNFLDANKQLNSMPEILSELKGKFGDTLDAVEKLELQKAFGTEEAIALIDLLYNKTGDLEDNILFLYDQMGEGISVATDMSNAINQTEGEKFEVLKQRISNTVEIIGNGMLPTVNRWMDKGAELLTHIGNWIGDNQSLVSTIFLVIAVIGASMVVLGTCSAAFGFLGTTVIGSISNVKKFVGMIKGVPGALEMLQSKAMYAGDAIRGGFNAIRSAGSTATTSVGSVSKSILSMSKTAAVNGAMAMKNFALGLVGMAKQAVITAGQAMPGLITSTWSFTTALLANPVTWIVIGIIALIAVLVLLHQNWDTVVSWLQGTWNGAAQDVINAFNWIKEKISDVPDSVLALIAVFNPFLGIPLLIIKHWDSVKEFFPNLWSGIREGWDNFINGWIPNMSESGKKVIQTFCDGIQSMISKPAELVKQGLAKVRNLLPFSDAKEGPLSELTLSGSKVFATIGEGMEKTASLPAAITEQSFAGIHHFMDTDGMLNFDRFNSFTNSDEREDQDGSKPAVKKEPEKIRQQAERQASGGTTITIGSLTITFDIKDLEDIKLVKLLIDQLKHITNQDNDDPEPIMV